MRTLLATALVILASSVTVLAQTTVTGTVTDVNSNPYANGTASAYSIAASGQATSYTTPVTTDTTGAFSIVAPVAGQYIFTICAPPALHGIPATVNTPQQVCFTSAPITISGSGQDISAQLNAAAVVLGPKSNTGSGGSGINCSGAPSVVIQSAIGVLAICDPQLIPDGNGGLSLVNLTASGQIIGGSLATTGPGGVLHLKFQQPPITVPAGEAQVYANSNTNQIDCLRAGLVECFNGLQIIASGTAAMSTSPVAAGGCNITTVAATGVTISSRVLASTLVDSTGVSGYGPSVSGGVWIPSGWGTTNNVNFKVCNDTANPITPGALTLTWIAF